jgi:thioredoxin-like negative regulator of GroEL
VVEKVEKSQERRQRDPPKKKETNAMGIEISEKQFEETVKKSDQLVLVYFHLPSCAKCGTWNGVAEGLVRDSGGKVQLVKLNVAENQGLAGRLNVLGAPSFIVFRDGTEVERFVGERVNYEDMYGYFENLTSPSD